MQQCVCCVRRTGQSKCASDAVKSGEFVGEWSWELLFPFDLRKLIASYYVEMVSHQKHSVSENRWQKACGQVNSFARRNIAPIFPWIDNRLNVTDQDISCKCHGKLVVHYLMLLGALSPCFIVRRGDVIFFPLSVLQDIVFQLFKSLQLLLVLTLCIQVAKLG